MTRSLHPGERFEDVYEKSGSRLTEDERSSLIKTILQELDHLVEELHAKNKVLPKVNSDGSSECPFAEDLFRAKVEAERAVEEKVGIVQNWIAEEEAELKRCERNINRLQADITKLNKQVAQQPVEYACGLQEREYISTKRNLDALRQGLIKAGNALEQTKPRTFPISLNERMNVGRPPEKTLNQQSSPCLDASPSHLVDELMDMGPLTSPESKS